MYLPDTRAASIAYYHRALSQAIERGIEREVERELALDDLFFLLVYILGRKDINRDWLFDRCREVQAEPDGYLDLWAREHFKTSIITHGLTIQDILRDPELTVGLLSFNRSAAKSSLRVIKREFESNDKLKNLFSDILWANPHKDSPKWSEDDGIIIKRKSNPRESTVEAHGLVEGSPTGKHFRLMIYDDVVTTESVTTPDMIKKVTESWEMSLNLSADGGKTRYIGTRYHFNDTYRTIIDRGSAIERRHAITHDGTADGEPVLWTRKQVAQRRRDQGPYVFGSQMLLNPVADATQGFKEEWLREYKFSDDPLSYGGMNRYILVDAANSKKKESDYTAIGVVGLAADENYYLLDGIRDRLNLTERADALFSLHKRWKPRGVGYEQYGMQSDIEHLQERMQRENYRFEITELGGRVPKVDRIRWLIPIFEAGRFFLPEHLIKVDYEGRHVDLVQSFIREEYLPFPVGLHDDFFDMLARIRDPEMTVTWPKPVVTEDRYARSRTRPRRVSSWAA